MRPGLMLSPRLAFPALALAGAASVCVADSLQRIENLEAQFPRKIAQSGYWLELGTAYLAFSGEVGSAAGRYEEALAAARFAVALAPSDADANHLLGRTLSKTGRPQEALRRFSAGAAAHPADHRFPAGRGYVLRYAGRFEDSIRSYRQAIALAGDSLERQIGYQDQITKNLIYLGQAEAALASDDRSQALRREAERPTNEKQHFYRGVACWYAGQEEAAAQALAASWETEPATVWSTFARLYHAGLTNDRSAARAIGERLRQREIRDGERYYRMVHAAVFSGAESEAENELRGAIQRGFFPAGYFKSDRLVPEAVRSSPGWLAAVEQAGVLSASIDQNLVQP